MDEIVEASTLNEGRNLRFCQNSSFVLCVSGWIVCIQAYAYALTTHYMHVITFSFLPSLVGDSTCSLNVGGHEHLWETRCYYSGKTHSEC
jgi:hypothetical protein